MRIGRYVDSLQRDMAVAALAGGAEGRELADRLIAQLSSAIHLTTLKVLAAAAEETTLELAQGSVEVRLRGFDSTFVVRLPWSDHFFDGTDDPEPSDAELAPSLKLMVSQMASWQGGVASWINFRPPEYLKARIDEAAVREQLSVNAWLVRSVSAVLESDDYVRRPDRRAPRRAEHYAGWVR
ncbi:hypothetical protein ACFWF7_21825 [Nocardia sp. NPDC060256]|uniref:hypothetical protein n=1 Tax=unclassified Nocardia TaxID=2637762 RepID=UPI00365E1D06